AASSAGAEMGTFLISQAAACYSMTLREMRNVPISACYSTTLREMRNVPISAWSTLRHALHVIVEAPSRLIGKFVGANLQRDEPIEAEVAEVATQLAPRAERPGAAPEKHGKWPHAPLRILCLAVAILELDEAMLDDGSAQRIESRAPLRID